MIVAQLLDWVDTAPDGRRPEAAYALARASLTAPASFRPAMEAALTLLLERAPIRVRLAVADALADDARAPRHIVMSLAADQAEVAGVVLSRSPLPIDAELVAQIASAGPLARQAIAARPKLSVTVTQAIAERADRDLCLAVLGNPGAAIDMAGYSRIAEQFGGDPAIRDALLDRQSLAPEIRQMLVKRLADTLGGMVAAKSWISEARAVAVAREATDRATVTIAADASPEALPTLVEHLRASGQLTTALMLRAVCSGNLDFFEAALAALSQMPVARVVGMVTGRRDASLRTTYAKAGLPQLAFDAFAAALDIWGEVAAGGEDGGRYLSLAEVSEAILARFTATTVDPGSDVAALLRQLSVEQAREAAHEYARAAA